MSEIRFAWNAYRELVARGADRETARGVARRYLAASRRNAEKLASMNCQRIVEF